MTQSALALSKKHGVAADEIYDHVLDLLQRFGNRQLGDTVARVGNDIIRKLGKNDRLVGAYNMCREAGLSCDYIKAGIAAATLFPQECEKTTKEILSEISGFEKAEIDEILAIAEEIKNKDIKDFKVKFTKELKA